MPTPKAMEMDETVSLKQQGSVETGPIVFINKFNVKPEQLQEFRRVWESATAFEKRQPGFISAQFHRGVGGSHVFINYAVWESAKRHTEAVSKPEFQELLKAYPEGVVESPHLFEKIAVQGICVS